MEVGPNLLGQGRTHAGCTSNRLGGGHLDGIDGAEVGQELFDPLGTQPLDVREARALHPLPPLLAMEADGKAMGLIPQSPEQLHAQLLRFALEGLLHPWQEHLLPLLCEGTHHQILVQIELPQGFHHR